MLGFDQASWEEIFCDESSSSSSSSSSSDSGGGGGRRRGGRSGGGRRRGGGGGRRGGGGGGGGRAIMANSRVHLSPVGLGRGTSYVMHSNMREGGRMSYGGRDHTELSWTLETDRDRGGPIRNRSRVALRMNGTGQYMHCNAQEGGGVSVGGRRHDSHDTWTIETADGGDVMVGSTIMLKGSDTGQYWHSNSPEGRGFSWGGRSPQFGWVVGPC